MTQLPDKIYIPSGVSVDDAHPVVISDGKCEHDDVGYVREDVVAEAKYEMLVKYDNLLDKYNDVIGKLHDAYAENNDMHLRAVMAEGSAKELVKEYLDKAKTRVEMHMFADMQTTTKFMGQWIIDDIENIKESVEI